MKKNISIFINSLNAGGAERVVSMILNDLKNDFDVYLVLLYNNIEYDIPEQQKIFCLNQSPAESVLIKILKLPLLAVRYKRFCKKNKIETSLSFLKRANYINCLSRLVGLRCRIIISERTYLTAYLKTLGVAGNMLHRFLTKNLYPKADMIVPNSSLAKTDLQNNFHIRSRYCVVYNPVNLKIIQEQSIENIKSALFKNFTFITVGGLRPEKNHDLLIDAFNEIKDLDCNLLLLGKGASEVKLKKKVKELELEQRIIFLGFDNNPYKYLSKASCFVLSSDFEGLPNSLQEALACNLPVISTDCKAGPREILAPDTNITCNVTDNIEIAKYGILVPVHNRELLSSAMRLIYEDKSLFNKLKLMAYERAKDFSTLQIMEQFKQILSDNY